MAAARSIRQVQSIGSRVDARVLGHIFLTMTVLPERPGDALAVKYIVTFVT